MLKECHALYETIREKIQSSKSGFFAWQWVLNNGIKLLQYNEKDIRVREE